MKSFEELINSMSLIETIIDYTFKDRTLFILPFIHRSYANEHKELEEHNERIEFLGDSVLGLIISEHLYLTFPDIPEGELSYLRSRLVEAESCVSYINKLAISKYLLLGKGEKLNAGRGRDSILADFFEALVGAIYVDGGIEAAKKFIFGHFSSEIKAILGTPIRNWKALLQDYCQKKFQISPSYAIVEESGPDHNKRFKVLVSLGNDELSFGHGSSKKEAQQDAAKDALFLINPNL